MMYFINCLEIICFGRIKEMFPCDISFMHPKLCLMTSYLWDLSVSDDIPLQILILSTVFP